MKTPTTIFGVILLLLGLLGFTSNSLIGANALFVADAMNKIVHIEIGGILLSVVFWMNKSCSFWLKIMGVVLFLLGLIGLLAVSSTGTLLGFVYTNGASNWFHLVFGIVMYIAGVYGKDTP